MLSFIQFVIETQSNEKIHKNPSPQHLKALVDKSKHNRVRFVIDKDGHMYAGDAHNFIHTDLHSDRSQWHARCEAFYHHNSEAYGFGAEDLNNKDVDHPRLQRLEKHGFERWSSERRNYV